MDLWAAGQERHAGVKFRTSRGAGTRLGGKRSILLDRLGTWIGGGQRVWAGIISATAKMNHFGS